MVATTVINYKSIDMYKNNLFLLMRIITNIITEVIIFIIIKQKLFKTIL